MSNLLRIVAGLSLIALGYALGHLAADPAPPVPPGRQLTLDERTLDAPVHEPLLQALLGTDPLGRAIETAQILTTTPPEMVDSVLATLERVGIAPGDVEVALIGEWMTASDPEVALQWAQNETNADHPWVFNAIIRSWARQDAAAAGEALRRHPAKLASSTALTALLLGWDEGGHPGLEQYMLGIEQGQIPQQAVEALVRRRLIRDGLDATQKWAESVPPDRPDVRAHFKRNVMRRTASAMVDWDRERAMRWAAEFGETTYGRGVYRRVAARIARDDGLVVMNWLRTLPAGPQRDSAVTEAWRQWMIHDRESAMQWMDASPDEAWIDPANYLYARRLGMTKGADQGFAWALRIDDNRRRQQALREIGKTWLEREPEAARAWAANPPEWADEETVLIIADPAEYKRRQRAFRQAKRAEYEARIRAAGVTDDSEDD